MEDLFGNIIEEEKPAAVRHTQQSRPQRATKPREKIETRDMTDWEIRGVKKLGKCNYGSRSWTKRFAGDMYNKVQNKEYEITEKQAAYLWSMIVQFKNQIKDKDLIEVAHFKKNQLRHLLEKKEESNG